MHKSKSEAENIRMQQLKEIYTEQLSNKIEQKKR